MIFRKAKVQFLNAPQVFVSRNNDGTAPSFEATTSQIARVLNFPFEETDFIWPPFPTWVSQTQHDLGFTPESGIEGNISVCLLPRANERLHDRRISALIKDAVDPDDLQGSSKYLTRRVLRAVMLAFREEWGVSFIERNMPDIQVHLLGMHLIEGGRYRFSVAVRDRRTGEVSHHLYQLRITEDPDAQDPA